MKNRAIILAIATIVTPSCNAPRYAAAEPVVSAPWELLNSHVLLAPSTDASRLVGALYVHGDYIPYSGPPLQTYTQLGAPSRLFAGFVDKSEAQAFLGSRSLERTAPEHRHPAFLEVYRTGFIEAISPESVQVPPNIHQGDQSDDVPRIVANVTFYLVRVQPFAPVPEEFYIQNGQTLIDGEIWAPSGALSLSSIATAVLIPAR